LHFCLYAIKVELVLGVGIGGWAWWGLKEWKLGF